MTKEQFSAFDKFRASFKKKVQEWSSANDLLIPLQTDAAKHDTPSYPIQTPIVYNTALDEITEENDIRLIVIGDNPGKNEQLSTNQKYLVGQSGKIAENFFKKNTTLNIDFRKNAIILNKTPIHTAKTKHLAQLKKSSEKIANLIEETQQWFATETALLHEKLVKTAPCKNCAPELWLVGYAELKKGGIFELYRKTLQETYQKSEDISSWEKVFVFQHFSMNRFLIDLNTFQKTFSSTNKAIEITPNENTFLRQILQSLGQKHKHEIFS